MTKPPRYVVLGASLTGGTAAATLRKEGFDGEIVLVGAEPDLPYERPPLSKDYLRRESPRDNVFLNSPQYYEEQSIELRLGQKATRLNSAEKRVVLDSGDELAYDKLLIATGVNPRELAVPGSDLPGVTYLRTLPHADILGEALQKKPHVLVVGAGFIGSEVAASARSLGCEVAMLEVAPVPLIRALGEELGAVYADFHREQGVDVQTNTGIAEFCGSGRLEAAVTSAGDVIPCDVAVIGVGVAPNTAFLEGSGLDLQNGVLTDEFCRSNAPDVFAAGDVANWWHPTWQERLRLEHYDNAIDQGTAVAKNMLGKGEPYAPVPHFWSDQYDLSLQYLGYASRWDEIAIRGKPSDHSFSAFYLADGRVRACLSVNRFRDQKAARRLISGGTPVDARRLSDEAVDLGTAFPP